jgi:hypothetical protein
MVTTLVHKEGLPSLMEVCRSIESTSGHLSTRTPPPFGGKDSDVPEICPPQKEISKSVLSHQVTSK